MVFQMPVGILEAHGAAALGTDILIPERMSVLLAEPVGALIAPTIPYGVFGRKFSIRRSTP